MKVSCIIIDDEKPARDLLATYVGKMSQLELTGSFKNPLEAMEFLQKNEVDIILLDIQMPELTGIEFLRTLSKKSKVIFTTAYSDYALESYTLDVVDYLLKPIRLERFVQAINKAIGLLELENTGSKYKRTISIKADHKIHRVNTEDINYIEGLKEYVRFYVVEEKIITLASLKSLEEALPKESFIRIHKSYIVNKTKVKAIVGNQVQIGEQLLPIGKSYREDSLKRLI